MPAGRAELLADADVIEWFLTQRGPRGGTTRASPVQRWVRNLRRWADGQNVEPFAEPTDLIPGALADVHGALADIYGARLLAWSIRVLEHAPCQIAASFVGKELCGPDHSHSSDSPALPGGVGTLRLAARCLHLMGGSATIAGAGSLSGSKNPDIMWRTPVGRHVVFERKDRQFALAIAEDAGRLAHVGARKCVQSVVQLPPDPAKLKIGCWGVVTAADTAAKLRSEFAIALSPAIERQRAETPGRALDAALAIIIGYGVRFDANGQRHAVASEHRLFFQNRHSPIAAIDPVWSVLEGVFGPDVP